MRGMFQRLSILALVILFAFSTSPEVFSKGSSGFSRSVGRSYSSRRSSVRSYSVPSSRRSSQKSSSPAGQKSTRKSYGNSSSSSVQGRPVRQSSAVRQRQNAMSSAKTRSAVSTKNMTSAEKRALKAQQRKETRNLKAENRQLKRKLKQAERDTARERRRAREATSRITINNFGAYYPTPGYSVFSLAASMVFANAVAGIYFHDYYDHMIYHSWLWYYHHPDYDRSHWSGEQQMEYARWRAYYDSQAIEPNPSYVDPETNRDEDYIASYVQENPDQFYGPNATAVTVEKLPDEKQLKEYVLAGTGDGTQSVTDQSQPQNALVERKIVVQRKTSGATWFILVFGSVLIIGIILLVMYNKGYF